MGVYPDISLADARAKRDEAKKLLVEGNDTAEQKKLEKLAKKITVENTFKTIAVEWHTHKSSKWSESYAESVLDALDKDIFPYLAKRPIAEIFPLEMLEILRMIEKRGALEKMQRLGNSAIKSFGMRLQ